MRCHLSAKSRSFLNYIQHLDVEEFLEQSSFYNAVLACTVLAMLAFDTLIAWFDNTYLATSYDDQIAILTFFFGLVGYLMGCAIVQYVLSDNIFSGIEFLGTAHFISLLVYFVHWIFLPPDDWNPVCFYLPEFYEYSFLIFPIVFLCHLTLAVIGVRVAWNGSKFTSNAKYDYLPSDVENQL